MNRRNRIELLGKFILFNARLLNKVLSECPCSNLKLKINNGL